MRDARLHNARLHQACKKPACEKPAATRPAMRRTRRTLLGLPALALALAGPARAVRSRVGEVSAVTGAALALFAEDPPRPLRPAAPVLIDDLLTTGAASRLSCRLEGGLELRLGGEARLRVDAMLLRGPQAGVVLRDLGAGGPLLLDRLPQPAAAPITVLLPWARIGVRGTRVFAGMMDPATGSVFVARGRVVVEAIGTRVTLAAGEGIDIPLRPFGPPDLPVRAWGAAKIAHAMSLVE